MAALLKIINQAQIKNRARAMAAQFMSRILYVTRCLIGNNAVDVELVLYVQYMSRCAFLYTLQPIKKRLW